MQKAQSAFRRLKWGPTAFLFLWSWCFPYIGLSQGNKAGISYAQWARLSLHLRMKDATKVLRRRGIEVWSRVSWSRACSCCVFPTNSQRQSLADWTALTAFFLKGFQAGGWPGNETSHIVTCCSFTACICCKQAGGTKWSTVPLSSTLDACCCQLALASRPMGLYIIQYDII